MWGTVAVYGLTGTVITDRFYPADLYLGKSILNASIATYVLISVERYSRTFTKTLTVSVEFRFIAIVFPLKTTWRINRKRVLLAAPIVWIFALVENAPFYYMYQRCARRRRLKSVGPIAVLSTTCFLIVSESTLEGKLRKWRALRTL